MLLKVRLVLGYYHSLFNSFWQFRTLIFSSVILDLGVKSCLAEVSEVLGNGGVGIFLTSLSEDGLGWGLCDVLLVTPPLLVLSITIFALSNEF